MGSHGALTALLAALLLSSVRSGTTAAATTATPGGRRHGGGRWLQESTKAEAASTTSAGESSLSARLWPVPSGYLPLYRRVFRMIGPDMVCHREAIEFGWRAFIEQTVETSSVMGDSTMRFTNYTLNPSTTAGLEILESVDEEAVVYIHSASESTECRLTPEWLAQSYPVIEASLRRAGVNATILALYGYPDQAPEITAAQLAAGDVVDLSPISQLNVSTHSLITVEGPDDRPLPAATDIQTALLLGLAAAAAQAQLPVLAFNVSHSSPVLAFNVSHWDGDDGASRSSSEVDTGSDADARADVWYQYNGLGLSVAPQLFWPAVIPYVPNATARHGLRMSVHEISSDSHWTTPNGTAVEVDYVGGGPSQNTTTMISPNTMASMLTGSLTAVISVMAVLAAAVVVAAGVIVLACITQRRQQSDAGANTAKTVSGGGITDLTANSVYIEDGCAGAWVTFDTGVDGRRVLIGRGAFSEVYLGRRASGQKVALKVLAAAAQQPATLERLRREVGLLQRVSFDANVVRFYGASLQHVADAVLVMEYCAGGNLRKLLSDPQRRPELLWRNGGRRIALDAARGLNFLHSRGVIHRDIKSSNILLDGSGRAKVADVGLACQLQTVGLNVPAGTFAYLPPEVLQGIPPDGDAAEAAKAGDCYAFGVVMWELVTGEKPLRARMRGVDVGTECCEVAVALIEACLSGDLTARPTAAQLVKILEQIQDDDTVGSVITALATSAAPADTTVAAEPLYS